MADVVSFPDTPFTAPRRRLATCTSSFHLDACQDAYAKLLPALTESEAAEWASLLARAQLRVAVAEALG